MGCAISASAAAIYSAVVDILFCNLSEWSSISKTSTDFFGISFSMGDGFGGDGVDLFDFLLGASSSESESFKPRALPKKKKKDN